eukprot:2824137-Alexandrium_andersonii.AAC.1
MGLPQYQRRVRRTLGEHGIFSVGDLSVALGRARLKREEDPRQPFPTPGDVLSVEEWGLPATELAAAARRRDPWGLLAWPGWPAAAWRAT